MTAQLYRLRGSLRRTMIRLHDAGAGMIRFAMTIMILKVSWNGARSATFSYPEISNTFLERAS